ncbi:hypothetical protein VP01_1290g1 [Puccinia sorghi]|uniref:Uncharacterized protein n=1 Tax=Puccinia sorghi TaxID=27349 RepID=A0A0L6VQ32_9BASI|nr:hypothetical protein VP01_1290g1 [Puccinia sorghi]
MSTAGNCFNCGRSSMGVVLDWLSKGSKHTHWQGYLEDGKKKKFLFSELIQIMIESGITNYNVKGFLGIFYNKKSIKNGQKVGKHRGSCKQGCFPSGFKAWLTGVFLTNWGF